MPFATSFSVTKNGLSSPLLLYCRRVGNRHFPHFGTLAITITLAPLVSSPRFFPHGHEQYRRKWGPVVEVG